MNDHDAFESWIHDELGAQLGEPVTAPESARYATTRMPGMRLGLALSVRTAAALAVLALCAGTGAVLLVGSGHSQTPASSEANATAVNAASNASSNSNTSSSGPSGHGAAVTSAVASCKAARPSPDASPRPSPGTRGIGDCVSQVASGGQSGASGSHPTPGSSGSGQGGSHPRPPVPTPSHP